MGLSLPIRSRTSVYKTIQHRFIVDLPIQTNLDKLHCGHDHRVVSLITLDPVTLTADNSH